MYSLNAPLMALSEWLVPAYMHQPKNLNAKTSRIIIKIIQTIVVWKITLTMYTSIPSFAIIAASDILVCIPPVVSWAAALVLIANNNKNVI